MKIAVPWKLCCLPLTNVQGSQNNHFVNLHDSQKFQNSQKKQKIQNNKNFKKINKIIKKLHKIVVSLAVIP